MSITGQVGHVAFAKQTAGQGSPITAGSAYRTIKVTGDSLVSNNNPLIAEGEIGLGRDISQMVPGGYSAAGAVNGNIRGRALDILFEGALGLKEAFTGANYSGIAGVATPATQYPLANRYSVADDLPWWTVEKKLGAAPTSTPGEQLVINYQDVMVNTLNLAIPAGGLSTFSAGLVACGETRRTQSQGPLTSPSYNAASDDLLVFHGGRIMNGTTGGLMARDETFQSIEIAVNNNIAADEYTIRPSRFLRSLTEGIRAVDVNMTLVFENPDKYSQYEYGAATNLTPGYSFYSGSLQVILANWQLDTATPTVPATPYDLVGQTLSGQIYQPIGTQSGGNVTGGFVNATPANAQAVQINIPKLAFTGLPVALASGRIVVSTSARVLKSANANEDILNAWVRPGGTL